MGDADDIRAAAAELPEGDVIGILLRQHAWIREAFESVATAEGTDKQRRFDELRAMLAVHETAEEMVLRPVSIAADASVAEARNQEEIEANKLLKALMALDVHSDEFDRQLAALREAVVRHAEAEERDEFPTILSSCDEGQRRLMGKLLLAAETVGPTRPHPSTAGSIVAQWAAGPVASVVDRTRDVITAARRGLGG